MFEQTMHLGAVHKLRHFKVDGRVITPNLFTFFMVPIHPNLQKKFFVGVGGWVVGGSFYF